MILLIVMTVYSIILIIDSVVSTFSKVAIATAVIVSAIAIYSNSCGTSNAIRSVSILSTIPSVAHATMIAAPV